MEEITKITGRTYHPFDYYGDPEAEYVIVAMGSVCETIDETIDYLMSKGEKVGAVRVRLYRPFSKEHFLKVLPSTVKKIAVLDRTKEPGSIGEPLYQDVVHVFYKHETSRLSLADVTDWVPRILHLPRLFPYTATCRVNSPRITSPSVLWMM
jgi:pyruvate-ferredoxin/flavodoxin oxidoreductase